jgi:hypothetical protein
MLTSKVPVVATITLLFSFLSTTSAVIEVDENSYTTTYQPGGLQSGPDPNGGSTFVASVAYSEQSNSILMTGSTWGRFFESSEQLLDENFDMYGNRITDPKIVQGCFVADVTLPGANSASQHTYEGEEVGNIYFTHRQRLRAPSSNNACNAIQLFPDTSSVMVAGHSEEHDTEMITAIEEVTATKQLGMLFDFAWNMQGDHSLLMSGGQQLSDIEAIYPTAMTSKTNNEADGLIVVFMEANNEAKHIDVKEGEQTHDPEKYFDYGAGYGFSVGLYRFEEEQVTAKTTIQKIKNDWFIQYNTTDTKAQVNVNDVVRIASGLIMVVGTTNGQGHAFGSETDQGKDLDGFIAKISPTTGQLIIEPGFSPSYRIQSNNHKHGNDWANGICHDPNDTLKIVYIVGTTEGKMPNSNDNVKGTSAYLMKFDARHMQPIWTKQIGASHAVHGMACAVTPDGKSVWIGGTVYENGVIPNAGVKKSFGGMDIFVAKLSTESGTVELLKQMGSDKDDEIALRGGLVTDVFGNAVVVGNTYGSLYRIRTAEETNADAFVLTVGLFDGATAPLPVSEIQKTGGSGIGRVLLWMILLPILCVLLFYLYQRRSRKIQRRSNATTPRSEVISYLHAFDIEDIELKHSATGGWHCNFVNKLAKGKYKSRKSNKKSSSRPGVTATLSGDFLDGLRRGGTRKSATEAESEMLFGDADARDESESSTGSLLFGGESDSAYSDLVGAYTEKIKGRKATESSNKENINRPGGWGKEII